MPRQFYDIQMALVHGTVEHASRSSPRRAWSGSRVGHRTRAAAVAALDELRATRRAYQGHVVVETPSEETP